MQIPIFDLQRFVEGVNISNSTSDIVITGTNDDDSIYNSGYNVDIIVAGGNNTIENRGTGAVIETGNGIDSILSDVIGSPSDYRDVTIWSGAGNDTVHVRDNETFVNAGSGNDIISISSSNWDNNTLQGGAGEDTIYGGNANVLVYVSGDGKDLFYNVSSNDTIKITSGVLNRATVTNGSDVTFYVGMGTISLVGAKDKTIHVEDPYKGSYTVKNKYTGPSTSVDISGLAAKIDNYMQTIDNAITSYANTLSDTSDTLNKFKTSTGGNLPDAVYQKIVEEMAENAVQYTNLSTITDLNEGKVIKQIGTIISQLVNTIETDVKVDGIKYRIKIPYNGLINQATVTNTNDSTVTSLTWAEGDAKNAFEEYFTKLLRLESEQLKLVLKKCGSDVSALFKGFLDDGNIDSFWKAFKKDMSKFKTTTTITKADFKAKFKSYVTNILNLGDESKLSSIAEKYITLEDYAKDLKKDKNITATSSSYTNFISAYNSLVSELGISSISTSMINDYINDPNTLSGGGGDNNPNRDISLTDNSRPENTDINGTTLILNSSHNGNIWLGGIDYFNNGNQVWGNSAITAIDGSQNSNAHVLAGGEHSVSIKAGSGSTTMWGGIGGNDTMVGGNSRDFFWYLLDGNGNDQITNFNAGKNSTSDVIVLQGNLNGMQRSGNTMTFSGSGGTLTMTCDFTYSNVVQYSVDGYNVFRAAIADSSSQYNILQYDNDVDYYFFGNNSGEIYVSGSEGCNVWLDGSQGKIFDGAKDLSAVISSGSHTLVGNSMDNSIIGSMGNSSLWGGIGGNDTLVGSSGSEMFWFGNGNGKDVITNADSNDVINLYDVQVSDILEYFGLAISSKNILITLNDGSQIDVQGKNNSTPNSIFQLGDGSRWRYNSVSKEWQNA